jgi:tetratricopeptide (TPR) repeat protein
MEPTPERSRVSSAARAQLDNGFRFEQGGSLERALEAYRAALAVADTPLDEAEARLRIARAHRGLADFDRSLEEARAALRLADACGADDLAAEAINVEVGALQMMGSFDEADALALTAISRAKSPRVRGILLQNLGRGAAERRDFETSDRYFDQSIEAFREAKYDFGLAVSLTNAARAALDRGNAERSIEIGHEAIVLTRRLNALDVLLTTVQNQAAAFLALGNLDSAELLLTEALGHFTSARNPQRQAECLEIMGQMNEQRPDYETAERCYSRARDLAVAATDRMMADRLAKRIETVQAVRDAADGRAP